jgi:predicted nuclease with RNAse H fold
MSSDHQNASQIAIALFRDRTELLFAAGRILPLGRNGMSGIAPRVAYLLR